MARFFGRYEHSVDPKGRVILPVRFRAPFERGGYLSQYNDGCLALWTPEEFENRMVEMEEAAREGRGERNRARVWSADTTRPQSISGFSTSSHLPPTFTAVGRLVVE